VNTQGFSAARIVTCERTQGGPLGVIADGALVIRDGHIAFVGPRDQAPTDVKLVDMGDRVITPGLVDAHTHACWVGSRHDEYAMRMAGEPYERIAEAGGGILATHRALVSASDEHIADVLASRLRRMASVGVTTVEVKSGYGLEPFHELRQLEAIRRVALRRGLPDVIPTLLALHALPPATVDPSEHVMRVARELIPEVARKGLARFVDAYIDRNAFAAADGRLVGEAARTAGLDVRFHAGQFADVGGAEMAASLGAASVDHLEHVSRAGVKALSDAGTRVVLLPVASMTLAQTAPDVAAMREGGLELVVASDANPGTAPTESLPLALALAVRCYGLSPDEALLGATKHAAAALRLDDRGTLRVGARADVTIWDLPHEHAIVQPWAVPRVSVVLVGGVLVPDKSPGSP
jgi:imidazolonepropionase